jgi:hypothetical protein
MMQHHLHHRELIKIGIQQRRNNHGLENRLPPHFAFPRRNFQARKRDIKEQIIIPSAPFERLAASLALPSGIRRPQPTTAVLPL